MYRECCCFDDDEEGHIGFSNLPFDFNKEILFQTLVYVRDLHLLAPFGRQASGGHASVSSNALGSLDHLEPSFGRAGYVHEP